MKKNVLICLERLDIGGVETFVLNQATVLLSKGHTVVILAKKGLYTEKLEQKGAICIDFTFTLESNFDIEKTKQIQEIIRKYEINEVHINQFPCILSAMPASILSKVPYIAYSHSIISGTYEWFMSTFDIYNYIFRYYFMNAYKIVAITQYAKNEIIKKFQIHENMIEIINNSIDFKETDMIRIQKKNNKKKFLLISRLSKEKEKSLYNGVELFNAYQKKVKDANLAIIGDGDYKEILQNYIEEEKIKNVEFKGVSTDILKDMNDYDIVIGLDRCILEAIAMKKISIIIGYKELKGIITLNNIEEASIENFSGNNLLIKSKEQIIEELINYTDDEIEKIVEENYRFNKKRFDAQINYDVFTKNDKFKKKYEDIDILKYILKQQEKMDILIEQIKNKNSCIELYKKQIIEKENCISSLKIEKVESERLQEVYKQELQKIYGSKRWKYTSQIAKMVNKIRRLKG